ETNILLRFPLAVKRRLIQEVTQCLLPNTTLVPDPTVLLTSPAHVTWAMEVVGQGFALPIEDTQTIKDCITLYQAWLVDVIPRPLAIRELRGTEVEQQFVQTIFKHFSVLFKHRQAASYVHNSANQSRERANIISSPTEEPIDLIAVHVSLCGQVLKIMTAATRKLGYEFTESTWIVLLKVLIGIAECILSVPCAPPSRGVQHRLDGALEDPAPRMGDQLCEHLMRVLIETWLRSRIVRIDMWDFLKRLFVNWTHRVAVIHQWNATTLGLTRTVIRLLYGDREGSESVLISLGPSYNVHLHLPLNFVFHSWHRMIYMIGNPNTLSPRNFEVAIVGISKIVETLHQIGAQQEPPSATIPDGNTILHMFGAWLFEATTMKSPEYDEGKSQAYGVLCRIFCQPQRRVKFLRTYLERFYYSVSDGLKGDSQSLTAIIMNSTNLFCSELEGLRTLAADYVLGLRRVLPHSRGLRNKVNVEELRRAALHIIGTISANSNRFDCVLIEDWCDKEREFGSKSLLPEDSFLSKMIRNVYARAQEPNEDETNASFIVLKVHLLEILLSSMLIETEQSNARYILNLLACFVVEDLEFSPGTPALVIKAIQDKFQMLSFQWSPDVMSSAFQFFSVMTTIWEPIHRASPASSQLIIKAYDILLKCIISGQWIQDDRECLNAAVCTLCRGIGLADKDEDFATVGPGAAAVSSSTVVTLMHNTSLIKDTSSTIINGPSSSTTAPGSLERPSGTIGGGNDKKKLTARNQASKLFAKHAGKIAAQFGGAGGPNTGAGVSTGTRDGGVGIPTFAVVSAEMAVKSAADQCMMQLINYFGNFPPSGELTGVSRQGTMWREDTETQMILDVHHSIRANGDESSNDNPESYQKFLRYFIYDKRIIIGLLEQPSWTYRSLNSTSPALAVIFRDGHGKFSWTTAIQYLDPEGSVQPSDEMPNYEVPVSSDEASIPPLDDLFTNKTSAANLNLTNMLEDTDSKNSSSDKRSETLALSVRKSYRPLEIPYLPNVQAMSTKSFNEECIPQVDQILDVVTESFKVYDTIEKLTFSQTTVETKMASNAIQRLLQLNVNVQIPEVQDITDLEKRLSGFRRLLAHLGFASVDSRSRLMPLNLSGGLLRDLEAFDHLQERDCISICTIFCKSGLDSFDDMIEPKTVSHDFEQFVYCLGWPVDMHSHPGFKGKLTVEICKTAPYFANRTVEMIVHCPCYFQYVPSVAPSVHVNEQMNTTNEVLAGENQGRGSFPEIQAHQVLDDINGRPYEDAGQLIDDLDSGLFPESNLVEISQRSSSDIRPSSGAQSFSSTLNRQSQSNATHSQQPIETQSQSPNEANNTSHGSSHPRTGLSSEESPENVTKVFQNIDELFSHITEQDLVYIVWIEDFHRVNLIQSKLRENSTVMFIIFIHPLPNTPGLYLIRLLSMNRSCDDFTLIGPLTDGLVVSRHALGNLVRTTAISAHLACRILKGNYRKP
ncbi:hypothetical protein BJ742DRAFT_677009, partial [Cladochytrium replicatum]